MNNLIVTHVLRLAILLLLHHLLLVMLALIYVHWLAVLIVAATTMIRISVSHHKHLTFCKFFIIVFHFLNNLFHDFFDVLFDDNLFHNLMNFFDNDNFFDILCDMLFDNLLMTFFGRSGWGKNINFIKTIFYFSWASLPI